MNSSLGSNQIVAEIESRIQTLTHTISQPASVEPPATAREFEILEQDLQAQARELADLRVAVQVQKTLCSAEFREEARQFAKLQPGRLRDCGQRLVRVRFAGGTVIALRTAYYARNCEKRGTSKKHKCMYPSLLLLGIYDRCTPGLASEIAIASAALCSLEEARHMLANHGCVLNIKTIRQVVKRFAARARLTQQDDPSDWGLDDTSIEGRNVVVSTDGGRLRIRKNKRGRKTRKGYSRYQTDWREPKLFIIYVANEDGRQEKTFRPYLDGTLNGPDAVFGMVAYYLKKLQISSADKLLFVADGALWIWGRVKPLVNALGFKPSQLFELIDFYHAVEHLNEFAKQKSRWSKSEREAWVKKQ